MAGSLVRSVASSTRSTERVRTGLPLRVVVWLSPIMSWPRIGWWMQPSTGWPWWRSPIRVPKSGTAETKDFVPSIGSSTHTNSAPGFSVPNSSPTMPWPGYRLWISPRMISSAPRSAAVTGEWSALISTCHVGAPEEGRDEVAAQLGKLDHEVAQGIEVHAYR